MSDDQFLAAIIATTVVVTGWLFRRLLWLRGQFNQRKELKRVFAETVPLAIVAFMWYQVLLLSTAYEFMRGSRLTIIHFAGLIAQMLAFSLATTLRISVQPYVLDMNIIRAFKAHRDKKAEMRRMKRQSARR